MPNLKVVLEGRGPITLTDNDYLAQGGEGTVYKKAATVVKIFSSQASIQAIRNKIKHLVQLRCPYISAPEGLVLSANGDPIGCYMPFVSGAALSLVFTTEFRTKEGFSDKDASILTHRMRETFEYAHGKNAILVDPNELNWLAVIKGKQGPEPRVIDVDSWVVDGKIPAKYPKMLSIHDWHAKDVSIESDWFAWAIVTFQLYTGIHPYKGSLAGYKKADLEGRMKDNKSVFAPGVTLNHAVRDFSCIPGKLLDWYRAVFSSSNRSIPPSPFEVGKSTPAAIQVLRTVTTATGRLKFERLLQKIGESAVRVFACGAVLTGDGRLYDLTTGRLISCGNSSDVQVIRVPDGWLLAELGIFGFIEDRNFDEVVLTIPLVVHEVVVANNRMFAVTDRGLTELILRQLGKPILSAGNTWGCTPNTKWFDGVGIMDALGAMFLIAPFGTNAVDHVRVRELDGLKPIIAKAGNRFVSVIALDDQGVYQKREFYFSADYTSYVVWSGTAASPDLNLTILPKGVCATIVDDGELVIFVPSSGAMNKIGDKKISTSMQLSRFENAVLYIENGAVWRVSVA
jgi:hypothetical protein